MIGQTAPIDRVDALTRRLADIERRLATAERSAGDTTAWAVPTLASGWASWYTTGIGRVMYRRVGDEVQLQGLLRRTGATLTTGQHEVFTLPEGFRPPWAKFYGALSNGSASPVEFRVATSGQLLFQGGSGGDATSLSYFAIDHIRFSLTAGPT